MPKINQKAVREAGATQNGVLVARCIVPRGTSLVGTRIDDTEKKVLFIFRVKSYAVPFYLIKAVCSMLKEGLSFHVFVNKIERESPTVELEKRNTLADAERLVH
jgi:hypothetical protein